MTMSEDHIYFRMLCFQVNQAWFVASAENFMKVLFLTYDVVRSYEYDRAHMAAREGTPQSMQLDGGLHTGCPRRNVKYFGRVFLMLTYTDITQITYIQG